MSTDVDETFKRIKSHKGVEGIIIVNHDGIVLKTSMTNEETNHYAPCIAQITNKTRSAVKELDPEDELSFYRIRSKKHEIMIAPENEYILIVIQNPNLDSEQ